MAKGGFYAVANGRSVGVFSTWDECRAQIHGYPGARYKKFVTESEALAFIANYRLGRDCKSLSSTLTTGSGVKKENETEKETKPSRKRKPSDLPAPVSKVPRRLESCDPAMWQDAPIVYTDGACTNNGRLGAKAGYGVYWGANHPNNACGPVVGPPTNNRGELLAVQVALKQAIQNKLPCVVVRTDSQLLINSLDNYMDKWKRNSWKTTSGSDVLNQDLLRSIDECLNKVIVKFEYVPGHSGDVGNDAADKLAREGALLYNVH